MSDGTRVCGWCGKEIPPMAIAGHLMDHAIRELIPGHRSMDPDIDDAQFYDYLCTQYNDEDLAENFHRKEFLKELFDDFKLIRRKFVMKYPPFRMSLLHSERNGFAIQVDNDIRILPKSIEKGKAIGLFTSKINQRIFNLIKKKDPLVMITVDRIMDNCNLNSHHAKVPISWKGIPVDIIRSKKRLYTSSPVKCGNSIHVTVPYTIKVGDDRIYIRLAKVKYHNPISKKEISHASVIPSERIGSQGP